MKRTPGAVKYCFGKIAAVAAVLFGCCCVAAAQSTVPSNPRIGVGASADKGSSRESDPMASIEEEMLAKRAIKLAEKQYQENLERARALCHLGAEINKSFKQKNRLDAEDVKRLDKLEKLAKGIRNAAGGSEDEEPLEKPPPNLPAAITTMSELTDSLKEKVEKTPRRVISTAIIDEANVLLELVRIIRGLPN